MVTLRVPQELHRRLQAARKRAGTTLTEVLLRSLWAGLGVWNDGYGSSPPANGPLSEEGPRVRTAFLCPEPLLREIIRVHALLRRRWPTMTLTDVTVGLLHMGVGEKGT